MEEKALRNSTCRFVPLGMTGRSPGAVWYLCWLSILFLNTFYSWKDILENALLCRREEQVQRSPQHLRNQRHWNHSLYSVLWLQSLFFPMCHIIFNWPFHWKVFVSGISGPLNSLPLRKRIAIYSNSQLITINNAFSLMYFARL